MSKLNPYGLAFERMHHKNTPYGITMGTVPTVSHGLEGIFIWS